MGWSVIIAEILRLLGPLISELLKRWLDTKLRATAARLGIPMSSFGDSRNAAVLLSAVHDSLWPWEWRRKRFVKASMSTVPVAMAGGMGFTGSEAEVIRTAAAGVS